MCFFIPIVLVFLIVLAWRRGSIGDRATILLSILAISPSIVMIIVYIFTEVI